HAGKPEIVQRGPEQRDEEEEAGPEECRDKTGLQAIFRPVPGGIPRDESAGKRCGHDQQQTEKTGYEGKAGGDDQQTGCEGQTDDGGRADGDPVPPAPLARPGGTVSLESAARCSSRCPADGVVGEEEPREDQDVERKG